MSSDDPWNQTAADNAEWLLRFKRDAGILPADQGPGLPAGGAWAIQAGGTGFAPPYTFPKATMSPLPTDSVGNVQIWRDGGPGTEAELSTANKFLQNFTSRYPAPATVFCSRELENGLEALVKSDMAAGRGFPTDAALRTKAREILGVDRTAADDEVLLGKFREMVKAKASVEQHAIQSQTAVGVDVGAVDMGMELNMTETEIDDLLQNMDFEFVEPAERDLGGDAMLAE